MVQENNFQQSKIDSFWNITMHIVCQYTYFNHCQDFILKISFSSTFLFEDSTEYSYGSPDFCEQKAKQNKNHKNGCTGITLEIFIL